VTVLLLLVRDVCMYLLLSNSIFLHFLGPAWLSDSSTADPNPGTTTTKPPFCMDAFLEGRTNQEAYALFFDRFIKCMGKKTTWSARLADAKSEKGICTKSDEAFALLLLENNFDRWIDIFDRNDGNVAVRRGQKKRKFESDVPTKYTKGGHVYLDTNKTKEEKGWSSTGIERFNSLFDKVQVDRNSNPSFIKTWLKAKKDAIINEPTSARKKARKVVQARQELDNSDVDEALETVDDGNDAVGNSSGNSSDDG
jgi:hypothetical protein